MLVPKPPRPVGRRRAVAEMIVAYKQAAPIPVGHVFELPPAEPAAPAAGPAEGAPPRPDDDSPRLSQSGHDTPV
jgi:hypothetical protein